MTEPGEEMTGQRKWEDDDQGDVPPVFGDQLL